MIKDEKCYICNDIYRTRKNRFDGEFKDKFLCNKHYLQIQRNGIVSDKSKSRRRDVRICDICGSDNHVLQMGINEEYKGYLLCGKHYSQVVEYGTITKRTRFDKNEIIYYSNYAEVIIYNNKQNEIARAIIDLENVELVNNFKWGLGDWGYAITRSYDNDGLIITMMQNMIYGEIKDGEIVDHINRTPLDNRRLNLRISDKSKNGMNANLKSNNTSGVSGVSYSNERRLWRAYINFNYKRIELGYFEFFEDAVRKRLVAEKEYHKEFSSQRHLFEEYGVI